MVACVNGKELRVKKIPYYAWAEDPITSNALVIQTLRVRYLEDRLLGESAKAWLERTS